MPSTLSPQPSVLNPEVLAIGAGLAGLTAALHLAERGLSILILEADPERAGGRVSGGSPVVIPGADGKHLTFPGEHAIHGAWGQYHNLRAVLDRAQIDPGFVPARKEAWILRQPGGKVQWSEGSSAQRLGIETPWPDLLTCGDWVRYPHPALYMECAVVTGLAAANTALGSRGLATWPVRQPDRPEIPARGIERFLGWVRSRARAYKRRRFKS